MRCLPKISEKKVHSLCAIILITLTLTATSAHAEEKILKCSSVLKFSAGIITSFAIHEGSHALAAFLTDTRMSWEIGTYNQPVAFTENATSDRKGVAVCSAGLLSHVVGSEIVLLTERIDKSDNFVRGLMAYNILNSLFYSMDYWFVNHTNKKNGNSYQGDIQGIEHYAGKSTAQGFAIGMASIAIFQGYRFLKTQSWAPKWLTEKQNSHTMNLDLLPFQGLCVTYKIHF